MHRLTGILIAVVLTAGILAGVSAPAEAKSYYFPKIDIDVTVRPDGSFEFREARSFEFDGDFTWAFYEVEKVRPAGGNRVDITNFVIGEGGRPFTLGDQRSLDDSKTPDSYWVSYDYRNNSVYVVLPRGRRDAHVRDLLRRARRGDRLRRQRGALLEVHRR